MTSVSQKPYRGTLAQLNSMSKMRMKDTMTYTKKAIYSLLYIGLAGVGFLIKKTDFHIDSSSLITPRDIPTLTICFDLPWEMAFKNNILIEMPGKYNYTLMAEGENCIIERFGAIHYLKLQTLNVFQHTEAYYRKCDKVSPMEKELGTKLLSADRGYLFLVKFTETTVSQARLYITSEENAYGVVMGQWFNGKVFCLYTIVYDGIMRNNHYLQNNGS